MQKKIKYYNGKWCGIKMTENTKGAIFKVDEKDNLQFTKYGNFFCK